MGKFWDMINQPSFIFWANTPEQMGAAGKFVREYMEGQAAIERARHPEVHQHVHLHVEGLSKEEIRARLRELEGQRRALLQALDKE